MDGSNFETELKVNFHSYLEYFNLNLNGGTDFRLDTPFNIQYEQIN